MRPHNSPYSILGVTQYSTQQDIKDAYRRLALKHHPDKGGDPEDFKLITSAYEQIKNTIPKVKERKTSQKVLFTISIKQQIQGINDLVELSNGVIAYVDIPPGARTNDKFKIKDSDQDYILHIVESKDLIFTRLGNDVTMYLELDVIDALLGTTIDIIDPEGNTLTLTVPAGTCNNNTFPLFDKGLYDKKTKKRGTLYVIPQITIPALVSDLEVNNFIIRLTNERN